MPLLRNTWDNQRLREPEPLPPTPSSKRTGLFGSRRSGNYSSTRRTDTYTNGGTHYSPTHYSSGAFSHRRSSDTSSDRSFERSSGRSVREESSILAARQKVADAENAESIAGNALRQARNAVREAKEHVRMLEDEAREE